MKLNRLFIEFIILVGLIIIISCSNNDKNYMLNAEQAYNSNNFVEAKKCLESITSENIKQSKEYNELLLNINNKIAQQSLELLEKAKMSFNEKKLQESKVTLGILLNQDNNNKDALELNRRIDEIQFATDNPLEIKNLTNDVKDHIKKQEFDYARTNIDDFLKRYSQLSNDASFIKPLLKNIDESENQAEMVRKQNTVNAKYKEAEALYNKKEYEKAVIKIEEILKIDASHKKSNNLSIKAKKKLEEENEQFWNYVIAGIFIFVVIILFILYSGLKEKCPGCGKWWAKEEIDSELIKKKRDYIFKTIDGERKKIPALKKTYNVTYLCKYCKHEWHTKETVMDEV